MEAEIQKPQPQEAPVVPAGNFITEGASFDANHKMADLKKLQDPSKYEKARFRLRLYKQP